MGAVDSAHVADLAEGLAGSLADVLGRVFEGGREGLKGGGPIWPSASTASSRTQGNIATTYFILVAYLKPALKRAGITKPFRPFHDLRHTALTHEAAAGNPMAYVQLKAGHSQSQITERYIHAAQVLFPGAAARGEERMFGSTAELDFSRRTTMINE